METFENLLGKENPLFKSIEDRGFETPSEIQEKSIPLILKGHDVIAGASTGSGKTLAFAAGLINNIKKGHGIQGLVLTPTRELAEQITTQLLDFAKYKDLHVIAVYGGVSITNQIRGFEYADIVVGTPGRILDHLTRRSFELTKINTLVLDEADRMLDMGFVDDVEKIINHCNKNRQTMLFSATISSDIAIMAQRYMKNPVEVSAEPQVDPKKLHQVFYDVQDGMKYSLLIHLLQHEKAKLVMIFCNTRRNVDFISSNLNQAGIEAVPIHGGYSQDKRNRIMELFHSEKVHVLVATDVAARGLDIKGVSHIYNYDLPPTAKEYIHRIGRTARAGEEGKVINLLASRDYENFNNIINSEEELKIAEEKTPFITRIMIRMASAGRRDFRGGRSGFRSGGGGFREGRSGFRGGRSSYGDNRGRTSSRYGQRSQGYGPRRHEDSRDAGDGGGRRYGNNRSRGYGRRDNRRDNRRHQRYDGPRRY